MSFDRVATVLQRGEIQLPSVGARHVWIVRQNWDFYHEEFYDEGPDLDTEGHAYYVLAGPNANPDEHSWRSRTCLTMQDAVGLAVESLGAIVWFE